MTETTKWAIEQWAEFSARWVRLYGEFEDILTAQAVLQDLYEMGGQSYDDYRIVELP